MIFINSLQSKINSKENTTNSLQNKLLIDGVLLWVNFVLRQDA